MFSSTNRVSRSLVVFGAPDRKSGVLHFLDPAITNDSLAKMITKTAEGHITLQHHLARILRGPQRARVMSQFQEPREVAWCKSLQDNTAGLWLDCAPKSEMHKIANDEFRVALTLRLFLHQKWIDVRLQERQERDPSRLQRNPSDYRLYQGRQLDPQPWPSQRPDRQDSIILWSEHQGRGEERIQSVTKKKRPLCEFEI